MDLQQHYERHVESLLAIDCGSIVTRVVLMDRVQGQYSFVARGDIPTSIEPPISNMAAGIRNAIRRIEESTGRVLLNSQFELITPEHSDASGVDLCVITCSAAAPLKVAVAGLVEHFSAASARRAARASYSRVTDSFALDSPGGRWGSELGLVGVIKQLYITRPDVILFSGGTDGGAVEPLIELAHAVAAAAAAIPPEERPTVVFAGNEDAQPQVAEVLAGTVDQLSAPNVLPTASTEQVFPAANQLDAIFRTKQLTRVPGANQVQRWSNAPIMPTVEALGRVIQFLARLQDQRVLGVDIGGANTAVMAAFGSEAMHTLVRTDLGLGYGLEGLLDEASDLDLFGWVPSDRLVEDMRNELANIMLRPVVRPQTLETMWLLQAAGREALRRTVRDARPAWPTSGPNAPYPDLMPIFDLIVGGGGPIRATPRAPQAALLMVDALEPIGVVELARDRVGIMSAIGASASIAPEVAADLMATTPFEMLGTLIAPVGRANWGDEVLTFRASLADGGIYDASVCFGEIERIPLPIGSQATLELHPERNFDIGAGPGQSIELTINGGSVGVIVDARGRPMPLADDLETRRQRASQWKRYIGA
jgi:hypothetical protein